MKLTMSNRKVILEMYECMSKGMHFLEIETYLKNHTTLTGYQLKLVRDNMASIQRRFDDIVLILGETLDLGL